MFWFPIKFWRVAPGAGWTHDPILCGSTPQPASNFARSDNMNPLTLGQAISAVETAQTNLSSADASQAAAQAKFDAAKAAKDSADLADVDAKKSFNDSLDALIAAATASKVV